MRANASSVDTDLGGGYHRYLGLVLTDAGYARINLTTAAFAYPKFPQPLVIADIATAAEDMQKRETHTEQRRIYRKCKNLEKALLCQTHKAIE